MSVATRSKRSRATLIQVVLSGLLVATLAACSGAATTAPTMAPTAAPSLAPTVEPSAAPATPAPTATPQAIELYVGMNAVAPSATVDTTKFKKDVANPTIGYSINGMINSFQVQRSESGRMVAEEYGAKFIIANANNDANKQVSDVQDLLAQGVDALVISPITPDSMKAVLKIASTKGVPVVIEGESVGDNPDVVSQVFYSNTSFGEVGGKGLCDILGGKGNVVMLRGIPGYEAEKDRYNAAKGAMEACGLKVLGEAYGQWSFAGGLQAAQTLVQKYPKIDGVWSSGAEMTRAAIQVFQQANRALPAMTGEEENGYLQLWLATGMKGVSPIYPTWQTPEAVKVALKTLRGEPVLAQYDLQIPGITDATLTKFMNADLSKDWWSDGFTESDGTVVNYLTPEQVKTIFP